MRKPVPESARVLRAALAVMFGIVLTAANPGFQSIAFAQEKPPKELAAIPPNKDTDLKFYRPTGPSRRAPRRSST